MCNGARQAVLLLLTLPLLALLALFAWLVLGDWSRLSLLLPGIIALPVYSLVPCLGGNAVPLSQPTQEAKAASRGLAMIGAMMVSFALAGIASWSWSAGWFRWLLLVETVVTIALYIGMRASLANVRWKSAE